MDDLIKRKTESWGSRTAIVDGNRTLTMGKLSQLAGRYAKLFNQAGVRRADRVALFLPRSIELVAALFAVWRIGAVAVIVNDVLRARQVDHIVNHSKASLLITNSNLAPLLGIVNFDNSRIIEIDKIELPTAEYVPQRSPIGADLALIIYTSGSTGMPKGIMLSHANLLSGAVIVADYLKLTERDILISLLPFSFDYGLNQLLTSLYVRGRLVIQRSVLPADVCSTVDREGVTGMACVPTLWQQLVSDRSPFLKTNFPSLRYITNTGGAMPEVVTRAIRRAHPQVAIFLMFGLTEAFRSTFLPPNQVDVRPTSIGKAIPNVEILVLNSDGRECKPGEVGELVHRGANVAMGYWNDPGATAERFKPLATAPDNASATEIAVFSGDFVKKDDEGYLYFVGRKDQMIKSHGMRVSPEEIEACIYGSGMVDHAVVFSAPAESAEEAIIAAIVPRDPKGFDEKALKASLRKELPEFMRPAVIWPLESIPLTSSGKPDRVKVRNTYLDSHRL